MDDLLSLWRSPIDQLALVGAERMAARQPRGDLTIDQLPPLPAPDPNDIVAIWHNASGKTVGCTAGSFGGGAVLPLAFNTDFSPLTIYNYGHFVNVPGLSNAANTAALVTMFSAMANPTAGLIGGMAWIPQYNFGVNATGLGLTVPDQSIIQGLGNGGGTTSQFAITGTTGTGDTFFNLSGTHTEGGIYLRNLAFQWTNPTVVGLNTQNPDTAVNLQTWGGKVQDCCFTDCPTAVAFGVDNPPKTGGLGCTLERAVIRYGVHATCPNNATAVIMSGEQAQIQGGIFFQQGIRPNSGSPGPTGCVGIGWGGGVAGSEHQVVRGPHLAEFSFGVDFSNPNNIPQLQGGAQMFTLADAEINSFVTALNLKCQTISTTLVGGHITGNTFNKAQNSNDGSPVVVIDPLLAGGGSNANINFITFVDNNIYSNVTSGGSHTGIAQNNQYGLAIYGGQGIRYIGGKIGNLGNNANLGADGSANVFIGGNCGNVTFTNVGLGPGYATAGGGGTGSGNTQWAVLIGAVLSTGAVIFDNCDMTGYGGGVLPVGLGISGVAGVGTLYVRNCPGYNDQDAQIATGVQVGTNTCSAYNSLVIGGINYYGPSYVQYSANSSGGTLTINGHTTFPLTANVYGFFWLNSPYDTFKFSLAPGLLNWRGR